MKYAFKVPDDMYNHRLIQRLRVKVKYDESDWASDNSGAAGDAWASKFYVYRFDEKEYHKWKDFSDTNSTSYREDSTYNLYEGTNDNHQYIGGDYDRVYVKIYAPDGKGWRNDDDANIEIDEVQVILELNHLQPPELTHTSPNKIGGKVNVPVDSTSYDEDTQLVTIKKAVSNIDFIDHTERTITVYIEDSG